MDTSPNPFAAPQADARSQVVVPPGAGADAEAERIRRQLLKHETSVKSIAWLYYLGSIFCVLAAIGVTVAIFSNESDNNAETLGRAIGILVVLIGSVALAVPGAGWLRKLDRRGRIPVGILSGFGLINFPVGTLVNAYILYLVFSAKGKQVLSDEYKEVIRLTPHIKYTTPLWLKIAAGVLLAAAALAIGLAFMPK